MSPSTNTTLPASAQTAHGPRPRRRADAERRIARIIDAAVDALGEDHEASMPEIARHRRHGSVLGALLPLIERGQASGAFRTDVAPGWHLGMLLALIHAGSAELRAGRVSENKAEAALVATVVGAVATPGRHGTDAA